VCVCGVRIIDDSVRLSFLGFPGEYINVNAYGGRIRPLFDSVVDETKYYNGLKEGDFLDYRPVDGYWFRVQIALVTDTTLELRACQGDRIITCHLSKVRERCAPDDTMRSLVMFSDSLYKSRRKECALFDPKP
jgi:hypothetical protein